MKLPLQVDVDDVRPVRPAHAVEDAVAQDAGIVDQDVDAAEGVERRSARSCRHCAGSLIDSVEAIASPPACLDLVDHVVRRPGIGAGAVEARADIADDDAGALLRHQQRNAAPDAASRAGDDGDFTGDDVRHRLVPQTSRATSPIMRSFAHSSSSASVLPSSVEAKPHCGDRQS